MGYSYYKKMDCLFVVDYSGLVYLIMVSIIIVITNQLMGDLALKCLVDVDKIELIGSIDCLFAGIVYNIYRLIIIIIIIMLSAFMLIYIYTMHILNYAIVIPPPYPLVHACSYQSLYA